MSLGTSDGEDDGMSLGVSEGDVDGNDVGAPVGASVGIFVGAPDIVGDAVGDAGHKPQLSGHDPLTSISGPPQYVVSLYSVLSAFTLCVNHEHPFIDPSNNSLNSKSGSSAHCTAALQVEHDAAHWYLTPSRPQ